MPVPAFPSLELVDGKPVTTQGMSRRDYFAAKAMQAMVTAATTRQDNFFRRAARHLGLPVSENHRTPNFSQIRDLAFEQADAMEAKACEPAAVSA